MQNDEDVQNDLNGVKFNKFIWFTYLTNTSHHFSKTENKLGGAPSIRAYS